jgi:hypothetical protein
MPDFQRGQGSDALPQGAATALNETQPDNGDFALENMDIPVLFAPGEHDPIDNNDGGLSENIQVLIDHPNPDYRAIPKDRQGRVPRYVVRHLPEIWAAVKDPEATPTHRALYNGVIRYLEQEMWAAR